MNLWAAAQLSAPHPATVPRDSWIAFDPHLTLGGGLAYPPWPEKQTIRFKHDLMAPCRSTCHDNYSFASRRAHRPLMARSAAIRPIVPYDAQTDQTS